MADAEALLDELPDGWLRDQVVGLRTVAGRLAGEQIAYPDEVEACYGVRPVRTDEAVLAAAYDELDDAPARTRVAARAVTAPGRTSAQVPAATIEALMAAVIEEARARTRDLFGLPDGESIEVEYVRDTAWLGYHEYLGDLRGRISINVDRPRSALSLLHLALHESYAGHQAERCHKEVALVRGRGLLEETIALVAAPQSVVSEGLAELAVELLLDGAAGPAFEALVRDHGIELDLAHARAVAASRRAAGLARRRRRADAARGGRPPAEVSAFLHERPSIDRDAASAGCAS